MRHGKLLDGRVDSVPAPPTTPLPAHAVALLVALTAAIAAQGAFYAPGQRLVGLILISTAVLAWSRRPVSTGTLPPAARPVLLAGTAFAAWAVVSAALAGDVRRAVSTVALLGGLGIVVTSCWRCTRGERETVARAVVGLGAAAGMVGWLGVAFHLSPWALVDQGLWRAAGTLTYANAAAGVLAPLALLALARHAEQGTPATAATACLLLTGLGGTLSRGGALALAGGLLVLGRSVGFRRLLRPMTAPALGAAVALIGLLPSARSTSLARPGLAIVALAVALLAAAGSSMILSRLTASSAAALVVVTGSVGLLLAAGPTARLTLASPDRVGEARAALALAHDRPIAGVGPGWKQFVWTGSDGRLRVAEFVHNEYLQVLAELGVVGFALLVWLMASIGRLVRRGRASASTHWVWMGSAAALVAGSVHAAFDFGWHVPAVALTGALLVGMPTSPEREEQS
jgi:O-antigen ligase